MQGLIRALLLILGLALAGAAPVNAQSTEQSAPAAGAPAQPQVKIDRRKLLVPPKNKDGTIQEVSVFEDPVGWARDRQQAFYGRMSGSLRQMAAGSPFAAGWTLMLLSFGYGVFHAAGPGHGKAVISAWLLATENELKRGIFISLMSAIIQALTAILLVSALFLAVASVGSTARNLAGILESASYAMIGLLGLYLVWTAVQLLLARKPAILGPARGPAPVFAFDSFEPRKAAYPAAHVHGPDCGCGHAHLPEARDLRGDWSLAKAFSLAFAVGIRPCTGAILVLLFANGLGLYWAGMLSVLAMAVGTFITVSAIAALAVYSKKLATRLAGKETRWMDRLSVGLRFAGGLIIAGLGTILFLASLGGVNGSM
jgi:nickel/cobalt transporter (NicO) family protein